MNQALAVLAAYACGSFPAAYLAGRLVIGADLRTRGSGNLGATNVYREVGLPAAIAVLALDVLKGWVAAALLPRWFGLTDEWWPVGLGAAAVAGHAKPVFLLGRGGGKGVATFAGAFLALAPAAVGIATLTFAIVVAATRYVSAGSIAGALALPVAVAYYNSTGSPTFVGALAITAFVVWAHRGNVGKIARGEERKIGRPGGGRLMRAAVIGAGAWGTALADLVARNGHDVVLWAHEADVAETINAAHVNRRFLPGCALTESLRATNTLKDALDGADLVIYAAPSHVLRAVVRSGAQYVRRAATLTVATKGIEHETFALMTDVVASEVPGRPVVALSGPSFAEEVAKGQPTAVVAASVDPNAARRVQEACSLAEFRIYTHDDVTGVELGGALKNVIAIAVGVADGLGLGYNTRAALITRGLAEMARLGGALGAQPATFAGLAGVGDLVLTCTGPLSRNRSVGVELGKGKTLAQATEGRETVAEGVTTARSAHALADARGIEMPIVTAVHALLFEGLSPRDAMRSLMGRELRGEQG